MVGGLRLTGLSWRWSRRSWGSGHLYWRGRASGDVAVDAGPFGDLEALRRESGLPVSRFTRLAGIPERTYRRYLARHRRATSAVTTGAVVGVVTPLLAKGPWPTPRQDAIEASAVKYAGDWPAWGHRKIAALMRADGHDASTSTIQRALRRRGLLLPVTFRAERKAWAMLRRQAFHDPPTRRNRVWQMDFSEIETTSGGIWRLCAVIDYVTKFCLALTVTPTSRGLDAVACVEAAIAQAERLLAVADNGSRDVQEGGSRDRDRRLRADRRHVEDIDETTGQVTTRAVPIALVTDNGPAFRSVTFAQLFTGPTAGIDPLLRHVRTRVRSPQTNGVVERFFGTLKYEHLYRTRLPDGDALAVECNLFRQTYNARRPHRAWAIALRAQPTSNRENRLSVTADTARGMALWALWFASRRVIGLAFR